MKRLLLLPAALLLTGLWFYGCDAQAPVEPDAAAEALFAKKCPTGTTACKGKCVDLNTDAANCGACGVACAAGEICSSGTCIVPTCLCEDVGMTTCTSGCADLNYDPDNCGSCGEACDAGANVLTAYCFGGSCEIRTCEAPYGDCNTVAADGCERPLDVDPYNCGTCGNDCEALPNVGGTYCGLGACIVDYCAGGWRDCDEYSFNGCEVRVFDDPENCGTCGNSCAAGQVCNVGTCEDQ